MKKEIQMEPINAWNNLINNCESEAPRATGIGNIYHDRKPYIAGIIFTSYCPNNCHHCIFHPRYDEYNGDLSVSQWKKILKNIYDDLDIKNFIYTGRSFNRKSLDILKYLKSSFHDIRIGIIDNGYSIRPFIEKLSSLKPDWIDISLDGTEIEHDFQRNQKGSYKYALETIDILKEFKIASKINILTCLTTINQKSIIDLIKSMNSKGLKNFFISPISALKGYRPSDKLKPSGKDCVKLIRETIEVLESFNDVWIGIELYDADYMQAIMKNKKEIWKEFVKDYDHLFWKMISKGNVFSINYYPLSLSGIREFNVNSNGDVIPPMVMAKGDIPQEDKFGSLLSTRAIEIVDNYHRTKSFSFYEKAFFQEKKILKGNK